MNQRELGAAFSLVMDPDGTPELVGQTMDMFEGSE